MAESPRIESARLLLRRFEDRDRAPFHALNVDPEVRAHFPGALTRAESDAFIDRINASIEQRGFGFFCAADKLTDECLGMIGLAVPSFIAPFTPCVEVGWRLARHAWGQGLATEGAQAALDFGWYTLKLDEILSFTVPANERSWRVMERLGMHKRGEFDHPNLPEGHPLRRHVLYAIQHPPSVTRSPPSVTRNP